MWRCDEGADEMDLACRVNVRRGWSYALSNASTVAAACAPFEATTVLLSAVSVLEEGAPQGELVSDPLLKRINKWVGGVELPSVRLYRIETKQFRVVVVSQSPAHSLTVTPRWLERGDSAAAPPAPPSRPRATWLSLIRQAGNHDERRRRAPPRPKKRGTGTQRSQTSTTPK